MHYFGESFKEVLDFITSNIDNGNTIHFDFITTPFSVSAVLDVEYLHSLYRNTIHFRYPNTTNKNLSKTWKLFNIHLNNHQLVEFKLLYFNEEISNYIVNIKDISPKLYKKYKPSVYLDHNQLTKTVDVYDFHENIEYDVQFKQTDLDVTHLVSLNQNVETSNLHKITDVVYNSKAYAAINSDGTITTWGDPEYGGSHTDFIYMVFLTKLLMMLSKLYLMNAHSVH